MSETIVFETERRVQRSASDGMDFLPPAAVRALTGEELTRRITELTPLAEEYAAEAERMRRPAAKVWNALRQSGYFYQFVPKRFGGMATDLQSFFEATLPLAEACASTAWTASFAAAHNRNLANFPKETQEEIWAGGFPYVIAPQLAHPSGPVTIETVAGGVRASGSWDWGTAVTEADWAMVIGGVAQPAGPPQMVLMLLPATEIEIRDTWHMDGMAGTGSHEVVLNDVFVPEHYILRDLGIMAGQGLASRLYPEAVFKVPIFSFGAVVSSVVALGVARRVVKLYRDKLKARLERGASGAKEVLAQARLGEADTMVRTAERVMRDGARRAGAMGEIPVEQQVPERIAFRAEFSFAVSLCRQAAYLLAEAAGASAHRLSDPFQRAVRDLAVVASHMAFSPDAAFDLQGGSLLGRKPSGMEF